MVLPRGFLGGSAPRLQELHLEDILPDLPKFLLSTCDLVTLKLSRIPPEAYISPETMVTCLAPMARLTYLSICISQLTLPSNQLKQAPAIRTRAVLPALISIKFDCVIRYAEDLVARIDCPRLNSIDLYPKDDPPVDLQVSQVYKFIKRSEDPLLTGFDSVYVDVKDHYIGLRTSHSHSHYIPIFISLLDENWRLSHIFQVFNQFSLLLSNVRHISINSSMRSPDRAPTFDEAQFLNTFSALRTLDVFGDHEYFAPALDYIGEEMAARLLPALELLYIEGLPVSSVDKFCAARQLSGHPVTVVNTHTEFCERRESYA